MAEEFFDYEKFVEHLREIRIKDKKNCDNISIEFLKKELTNVKEIQSMIIDELVLDLHSSGQIDIAEIMIKSKIELDQMNPLSWMEMAKHRFFYRKDRILTKYFAEKSINVAKNVGNFYISCSIDAISIYIKMGDLESIEKTICDILDYIPNKETIDSSYSVEFISSLDKFGVSSLLIKKYEEKFGKK